MRVAATLLSSLFVSLLAAAPAAADPSRKPAASTKTSKLKAVTRPAGATLLINADPVGKTPLTRALEPDTYWLTFELDGYEPALRTVELKEGAVLDLAVDLVPKGGKAISNKEMAGRWKGRADSSLVAFGGGSGYCSYTVALKGISLDFEVTAAKDVRDLTFEYEMVESARGNCGATMGKQRHQFTCTSVLVGTQFELKCNGRDNSPPTEATYRALHSENGFEGTLRVRRTDWQGSPVAWTVEVPFSLSH